VNQKGAISTDKGYQHAIYALGSHSFAFDIVGCWGLQWGFADSTDSGHQNREHEQSATFAGSATVERTG
jgi:hypothetical protein